MLDLANKQANREELLQVLSKYKGERMVKQYEKSYDDNRTRIKSAGGYRSSDKQ